VRGSPKFARRFPEMATAYPGIDEARVTDWLADAVPELRLPLRFQLIAAGGSNLSYRVEDAAGNAVVLRRPPVAGALATAHDMGREWRIMKALAEHDAGIPVPRMLAFCSDAVVTGAQFYVMEFVDGLILRDRGAAELLDAPARRLATESLIATQVAFHTLDPAAVGLADLGPTEGYVSRQLRRWMRQVEAGRTRELPQIGRLHECLVTNVPKQQARSSLVHGDFRFDNTILGEDSRVRAVLDWELCTLGDPVADFFWSLMYWAEPEDEIAFLPDPPTRAPGFPRRAELMQRYAELTGFDLSSADFYIAFGWWKQACIVEGVYSRLVKGGTGGMGVMQPERVARVVESYLERAAHACAGLRC